MRLDKYEMRFNAAKTEFEFVSVGPKGEISKNISFLKMRVKGFRSIYNLEFGDMNPDTGEIDDRIVSDNQDRDKVLATIASAVFAFFGKHPKAKVFFKGSTPARTRLYRRAIGLHYEELIENFDIQGVTLNSVVDFEQNGNYRAFLISKKTN